MTTIPVEGALIDAIVGDLAQSSIFSELPPEQLREMAMHSVMLQCDQEDVIMEQGQPSDSLYLIVAGEVILRARTDPSRDPVELVRVRPYDTLGELGLLLNQPRTATAIATQDTVLLKIDQSLFFALFEKFPKFSLLISRLLARRLRDTSQAVLLIRTTQPAEPDLNVLHLLPAEFMQQHRVLPLRIEGQTLHLGFVDDPDPHVIHVIHDQLPSLEVRPVAIERATFNAAMESAAQGRDGAAHSAKPPAVTAAREQPTSPKLDVLLRRMVAEGASDVHLSAGHKPRWRRDGQIAEIPGTTPLGASDVMELVKPIMLERNIQQFGADNDTDYAYSIADVARFRVNLFRDHRGVGAVFRQIPSRILSVEQLGLPPVVRSLCDYPKGLILVTGPTGSGKSTTLAAMIDHINNTRESHIITLEDPIEFVHESRKCLVNQREIESHTTSFARALRAALREDPDIVLVGEMRDLETVALALETANTGHLVFATLHTNTAISSVDRIIDMFPAEQQGQVRAVLADTLKGVLSQTLCRKVGGGRVAALEILVSDTGIANLIREGKTHQVNSAMQTGRARGNRLLNDELVRLVMEKLVAPEEAQSKSVDKEDFATMLKARTAQAEAQALAEAQAAAKRKK